ncbi:insulin-like growth factor-binding protein 2-B [Seriola lalandi dorsalis]|uniref:Insulin-like growth factor binding protein 2b n=1 Tax=Seriola lalandi dorsalis TaxID=1841481 RepID=A0A3B4Y818_SERLL|nr:insulin-like growth factor-binding protein 2-B [Seriola lalandi dorsalis]XP_056244543.1 insulin-like growth factor-binding protein 2-B [Seriola aureovittata]ACD11355.1 IGF binding protein 2 [Seriola quinqueradiata]
MVIHFTYGWLFAYIALPGILLGDLAFRCPSCTAARLAACPKVTTVCAEIVREPGCGCCPMCARLEGELCGVYTPRCSTGLRCYPSAEAELPLQQLIQGLGRCGQKVEIDSTSLDHQATNEVHGTENPLTKRPAIDAALWQESARQQYLNERKTKMKTNQLEDPRTPKAPQSACQTELDKVLEEISKMTSEDNRGPLENLYGLKFPNCDRHGLYNLKQCNMSTHGQRGECWCVNPLTGIQIPATPKVRGDPNCNQFQEELRAMPTASTSR